MATRVSNVFKAIIGQEQQVNVWLLTRQGLDAAPLVGMARVFNNEYTQAVAKIAYLDPNHPTELTKISQIIGSTSNGGNETELRFVGDGIEALRLNKVDRVVAQENSSIDVRAEGSYYEAYFQEPTILDSIAFRNIPPRSLGDHEVEISVQAAGLNFKDVLNGMGLLTEESVMGGLVGAQLGLEMLWQDYPRWSKCFPLDTGNGSNCHGAACPGRNHDYPGTLRCYQARSSES